MTEPEHLNQLGNKSTKLKLLALLAQDFETRARYQRLAYALRAHEQVRRRETLATTS
jgi:hypothetical protein